MSHNNSKEYSRNSNRNADEYDNSNNHNNNHINDNNNNNYNHNYNQNNSNSNSNSNNSNNNYHNMNDSMYVYTDARSNRMIQNEAAIREEMFKECTFQPKIKELPSAYGVGRDTRGD